MALQRWSKQVTGVYTVETFNQQAVYTFPAIPQGFAASVSVAVPGSGPIVNWTVLVAGQIVGSTLGAQPCGPIYLGQGDVLSLIGDPITNVGVAVASGAIGLPSEIPPASIITNNAQSVDGANLVAVGTGTATPNIPLNGSIRGLLVLTNPSVYPNAAGGDVGLFLPVNQNALAAQFGAAGLVDGIWFLPTPGVPFIPIGFSASTSWQVYYVEYDFDFYEVARGLGVYPVAVPNPPAAGDWSYVLPSPGRLKGITAVYSTSAGVANRFPALRIVPNVLFLPMVPAVITASLNNYMNLFAGAPLAANTSIAGDVFSTAPIPDLGLLPAGTTIETTTFNVGAGDQWAGIELSFTAV